MNKQTNLILLSVILGGSVTFLSAPLKIAILTGIIVVLFMRYDIFEYESRTGESDHE